MSKIDVAGLNALRPKPKPSKQPLEPVRTPSDDGDDPMEEDRVSTGRTQRKRKEKSGETSEEEANEKENENFQKGQASTDTAYYKSVDTNFNRVRDGDYSIGSLADEHHHESFAVETITYTPGADKLQDSFTDEELLNMQKRVDTNQFQAEAAWERTRSSQSIETRHQQSIDKHPQQSIDTNNTTSIDNHPIPKTTVSEKDKFDNQYLTPDEFGIFRDPNGYAKAIDGRTLHVSREDTADILQTANGADNLFMHQRSNREQKTTKEFYGTAGGIENNFKQRSRHTTHPSINIDVPTFARRPEFGKRAYDLYDQDRHTIPVYTKDIRRLLDRASKDEPAYICLPEHASSFTQMLGSKTVTTKLTSKSPQNTSMSVFPRQIVLGQKNVAAYVLEIKPCSNPVWIKHKLSQGNRNVSEPATDSSNVEIGTQIDLAQSLRNYRTCTLPGRYVATERLSRSVATVATQRPSSSQARSQRSHRASIPLGRYVATKLGRCLATERPSRSVAT
ncbi:hypothetical protein DY000_02042086 [Brassica cretica]|uniref:Uncharacterized protein n=1 Tax=Brassica cretica TaxID=69181 RepID=A0ABQ7BQT8_BRACR|nr:hypothetical protein DY000_02042086 [Brassica cretica]